MPAHWWVELGLGPPVGRAVSKGMSRGICWLRKSLGSLSADGWGCIPAHLVEFGNYFLMVKVLSPPI